MAVEMAVETNDGNSGRSTENCRRHPDGVRCPFCGSVNTIFKFLNNKKVGQPRYQCSDCKLYWTEGGRIRGPYAGTRGVRNSVATDTTSYTTSNTTDTTWQPSQPSQPSVSALSTPTPTASDGASMGSGSAGGGSSTSRWNALLEAAKRAQERDFPDLD